MNSVVRITSLKPHLAIPGSEIIVNCEGFAMSELSDGCFIAGVRCRMVAASATRILANIPFDVEGGSLRVHLASNRAVSNTSGVIVGRKLAEDMHIVANPAIDPSDGAIILTRSGGRGQHLPATLFRLEPDGFLEEMPEAILNPTGLAFGRDGLLYVTNRAQGEVYAISRDGTATVFASGLGIATGVAFDEEDRMYVGDRSGTIYRVREFNTPEFFASLEPSVAAYHMAFGPDGRLYVTAPGLASNDAVYAIDNDGRVSTYSRGFGRPQGLAFDKNGDLYLAACYMGLHGIIRVSDNGKTCEHTVAGNNIVGLCFTQKGEMVVATGEAVYSIACGIEGTLLS